MYVLRVFADFLIQESRRSPVACYIGDAKSTA